MQDRAIILPAKQWTCHYAMMANAQSEENVNSSYLFIINPMFSQAAVDNMLPFDNGYVLLNIFLVIPKFRAFLLHVYHPETIDTSCSPDCK